jgi:hypothetical protein
MRSEHFFATLIVHIRNPCCLGAKLRLAGSSVKIITKLPQKWPELLQTQSQPPEDYILNRCVTWGNRCLLPKGNGSMRVRYTCAMPAKVVNISGPKCGFSSRRQGDDYGYGNQRDNSTYYVYFRKSDDWALVHRARCRFVAARCCSQRDTQSGSLGTWLGPFAERSDGFAAAQSQGVFRVRACYYCKP